MTAYLIVGGGFVGAAIVCQLLKAAPAGSSITLINSGGTLGRGLAYGTQSPRHLLNVPAARMSWTDERPNDFVEWLEQQGLAQDGAAFVPRQLYGDYLAMRLQEHVAARPDVRCVQLQGRVATLKPVSQGWQAQLADRSVIQANQVFLALGNFAPACPHPDLPAQAPGCYVADPWDSGATAHLPPQAPVALIGTGLTMLDQLISLQAAGHQGPILALSRRGLLPQAHRPNELPPATWHPPEGWLDQGTLRQQFRAVRGAVAEAQASGHDWRDVWVALRPRTSSLWQRLDRSSRAQLIRHLLPLWDVHRHRAAPQALETLRLAQADGRLRIAAGRLVAVKPDPDGASLHWRPRGSQGSQVFKAARIFNCTGPSTRLGEDRSGLFDALLADGRLLPCPHGLGLQVSPDHALVDAQGRPQPGLYYVGPMLRSQYWEATAVPELRVHAKAAVRSALAS